MSTVESPLLIMTLNEFSDKFFSWIFYDGHDVLCYVLFSEFSILGCSSIWIFIIVQILIHFLMIWVNLRFYDGRDTFVNSIYSTRLPKKTLENVLYVSLLIHISNQLIKPGFEGRIDRYRSASVRYLQKLKGRIEE